MCRGGRLPAMECSFFSPDVANEQGSSSAVWAQSFVGAGLANSLKGTRKTPWDMSWGRRIEGASKEMLTLIWDYSF